MTVLIVDEEFSSFGGHHAAYDLPIIEELERRRIPCVLLTDMKLGSETSPFRVLPAFNTRAAVALRSSFVPQLVTRILSSLVGNLVTSWDLVRKVTPHTASGDLIVLARPLSRTRIAYGVWLWYLKRLGRRLSVIYVVHNEPEPLFGSQIRILRRLAQGHHLEFVAHSPAIAAQVGQYLGFQPKVIALPFKPYDLVDRPSGRKGAVRFAFLGLGHHSKGLDLVLQAVKLCAELVDGNKMEFTIQCYLPFRDHAAEELHRSAKELSVTITSIILIEHELRPSEYLLELQRSDVVLVPHRLDTYRYALSGVFADAMAAGRPVIVAEGSYMSELVRESGAGVSFESGSGLSLQRAIVEAARRIDELLAHAKTARERWVREQGPDAFVTLLLQLSESPVVGSRD